MKKIGFILIAITVISLSFFVGCGKNYSGGGTPTPTITPGMSISGKVLFGGPGSPSVEGVTVTLDGTREITTNAYGIYSFSGLPLGTHEVAASKTGWIFSPENYTFTTSSENKNFIASIEGWTVLSSPAGATTLYSYSCISREGYITHAVSGANGNLYVSNDNASTWYKLTASEITSGGNIKGAFYIYNEGNQYISCFSGSKYLFWENPASTSANPDVSLDFSSFAAQPDDLKVGSGPLLRPDVYTTSEAFMAKNGELYYNQNFYNTYETSTPADFGSTNRAPALFSPRCLFVSGQYILLAGGDNGKLYFYYNDVLPTTSSPSWEIIATNTDEKIAAICSYLTPYMPIPVVTEGGTILCATLELGSMNMYTLVTGLPYRLYGVARTGDSLEQNSTSGIIAVGEKGIMIRKN